ENVISVIMCSNNQSALETSPRIIAFTKANRSPKIDEKSRVRKSYRDSKSQKISVEEE
ncbi:hypothetical protein NPIL_128561, partial [Nephila pilipes]